MQFRIHFFILLISLSLSASAQNNKQAIAILDLSERNEESNDARLISANQIIDVVGIAKIITQDINTAIEYSMVFCTSFIDKSTLTSAEEEILASYVGAGGILVTPRLENDRLFDLFGVNGYEASKSRYEINWDLTSNSSSLQWINEPEEQTISLGRSGNGEIFKTLGYELNTAESLANYPDGTSAITRNSYGSGFAITLGVSWKDVILRNQINRDYEAQRTTSNGFEPTSDVFMLFIRGLFLEYNPYSVYKNTSPQNSKSTLMVTHDIDSQTGMDSMFMFADFEEEKQIEATYNITVKYFADAQSSAFYNDHETEIEYVLDGGHQIQSHSVGHFDDFADDNIIGKGVSGNTKENYTPYNDGDITTGATVFGECEVSKDILESDFDIDIRTFRAGHLAYPKDLIEVLEALDYEYNSSNSANDVLTNFPYPNVIGKSFSQRLSSVYEIPVTISDVFSDDPISNTNYLDKAEEWVQTTLKNTDNGAPTLLLIHPNRSYKLQGLRSFLFGIDDQPIEIMEIGKFGDFWKNRKAFDYTSVVSNGTLTITMSSEQSFTDGVSLIINDGQDLDEIIIKNESNEILNFVQEDWEANDVILFFEDGTTSTEPLKSESKNINVYPIPAHDKINIEHNNGSSSIVNLSIQNMNGKTVFAQKQSNPTTSNSQISIDLSTINIPTGVYVLVIENENGEKYTQKIVLI